jgi:hypothetical protein
VTGADGSEFDSREAQDSSRLHEIQTGSGKHPMGTAGERQRLQVDHSPPSSAEVTNT